MSAAMGAEGSRARVRTLVLPLSKGVLEGVI